MILGVLDDLLFSSKIRAAAGQAGTSVTFARSPEAALDDMRRAPPSLVIFDLDNPRANALAIVAAMKQDESLASVRTVGYASHVHADVIQAARKAGIDEVLARSAFVQRLGDILRTP